MNLLPNGLQMTSAILLVFCSAGDADKADSSDVCHQGLKVGFVMTVLFVVQRTTGGVGVTFRVLRKGLAKLVFQPGKRVASTGQRKVSAEDNSGKKRMDTINSYNIVTGSFEQLHI